MNLKISLRQLIWFLVAIGLLLCVAYLAVQSWKYFSGHSVPRKISYLLDMNVEYNLPTFYSVMLLLFSTLLLALIAAIEKQFEKRSSHYWSGLAAFFAYLAIDEGIQVHEFINRAVQAGVSKRFDLWNLLIIAVVFTTYSKFFLKLPLQTRWLFTSASVLFITGAIGIEILGVQFFPGIYHQPTFAADVITALEELLEMIGISVFIYALLAYIHMRAHFIHIEFAAPSLMAKVRKER